MSKNMIHWGRMLFTMTILVTMCSFYRAQDNNSGRPAVKDSYAFLDRLDSEVTSQEEKMIKKAYDKLTFLANARRKSSIGRQTAQAGRGTNRIAFSVNIISSGGIEEISGRPMDDLLTQSSDEQIGITRVTNISDKDKEGEVSYSIHWTEHPYISMNDRGAWPLRDLLTAMGPEYANVRKYTTYEVVVVLDGKSKNYLALALYHTPLQSSEEPRIEIWDLIAGVGGVLTKIFYEQGPPLETSLESISIASECSPCTLQTYDSGDVDYSALNRKNHEEGFYHRVYTTFHHECVVSENCVQKCSVKVDDSKTDCYDTLHTTETVYSHHVCNIQASEVGSTGNKSVQLICRAGVGYAFDSCISANCNVSISVSWSGFALSVTGGPLWKDAPTHEHTCMARP